QREERAPLRGGILEHERALAEVVRDQGRPDDGEPREANGARPEVTHVGVERLAAGDGEDDRPEDERAMEAVRLEEAHGVRRVQGREDGRVVGDVERAEPGDRGEPERHHGPEHGPHLPGAAALDREEPDEHRARERQDERLERGGRDLEPFHRAQHRDGGRDHAVAVEERRADDDENGGPPDGGPAGGPEAGRPEGWPLPRRATSLAILKQAPARVRMAPLAATSASWPASAANLLGAVRKGTPGSSAIFLATPPPHRGCVLSPVPTA